MYVVNGVSKPVNHIHRSRFTPRSACSLSVITLITKTTLLLSQKCANNTFMATLLRVIRS